MRFLRVRVLTPQDQYCTGTNGRRDDGNPKTRWKGGSGDWITMKYLKDPYPVPLCDYALANDIQEEPDFAWWVPFTFKKRIPILKNNKS